MKPDICIYHGNCADGFTAAWAVWKQYPEIIFHPGIYGESPPDVTGANVVLVDFSYKRSVIDVMGQTAQSIVILDHHKTAEADLSPFRIELCGGAKFVENDADGMLRDMAELDHPAILAEFDMERSGAQMAWDYFHHDSPRPRLVDYVGDRDLWQFKLQGSREIAAMIFSYGYDFDTWDQLESLLSGPLFDNAIEQGAAIERKHHKDITELLKQTRRSMVIGGVNVPVANLPYTLASDAAGQMAADAPFAACYFDRNDGQRIFSLRSRGLGGSDVSAIAAAYGGGGHKNAAGFQMPIGWEGDNSTMEHSK